MHKRLEACPVERADPPELGQRAWELAERHGWGRTYDAEYVALAQILDCRVVTIDARLRRGAAQLGIVIGLDELLAEKEQAESAITEPKPTAGQAGGDGDDQPPQG
jgi:hypothetical protein